MPVNSLGNMKEMNNAWSLWKYEEIAIHTCWWRGCKLEDYMTKYSPNQNDHTLKTLIFPLEIHPAKIPNKCAKMYIYYTVVYRMKKKKTKKRRPSQNSLIRDRVINFRTTCHKMDSCAAIKMADVNLFTLTVKYALPRWKKKKAGCKTFCNVWSF